MGIACTAESTSNDDGINSVNTVVEDTQAVSHADSTNELNNNIQIVKNNKSTIKTSSEKINTNTTVNPVLLDENKAANITAIVTAVGSDEVVNNGKITFKLNGKTLKDANGKVIYVKVVNGVATLEYSFGKLNSYNNLQITAVYAGSTAFNASRS